MSNLPTALTNNLPAFLVGAQANQLPNDLEDSVRASYAVVSLKGKVFSIKYGGDTQHVLNAEGYPAQYLDVVLVAANPHLNKTYYATTFNDESAENPDCWSEDGVLPAGPNPVHANCATCPKNQWGSRVSDNGSKGKACSDNRKVVVVPKSNVRNEKFNGGMLLRIAPMSLQDLKSYSAKLRASNIPYYAVVTRISFDPSAAFPKLMYQPVGYLSAEEYAIVMEMRDDDNTKHILEAPYTAPAEVETTAPAGLGAPPAYVNTAPSAFEPDRQEFPQPEAPKPARASRAKSKPEPTEEAPVQQEAPVAVSATVPVPEELSATLAGLFG